MVGAETETKEIHMTDNNTKKRPDFIAHAVIQGSGETKTRFIRIGVGFALKNGGTSILTDGIALSGHLILVGIDDEIPSLSGFKHGTPMHAPHYVASMVRDSADGKGYWNDIGAAY